MNSRTALTGMMGAGKSVVGRLLGRKLSVPFLDMDEEIERREEMAVREIFRKRGEASFRLAEFKLLEETCGRFDGVLATGGGTIMTAENRALLSRWGKVVYLRAPVAVRAGRRAGGGTAVRPLLDSSRPLEESLEEIVAIRRVFYEKADLIVDTEGLSPGEVCTSILEGLSL